MKRHVIGLVVAAGVVFCGVQVLGTVPTLPMIGTETVAHASDATTVVDSETAEKSELGTCPWQLTADGVLHVGSGELPEATKPYSDYVTPFFAIQIREGADQNNLKFKTISFDGKVTTPVNASFLFANFLNDTPQIKNWQNLDTSKSTNFAFMFLSSQQNSIDVSKFDTSNATDMHGMFNGADPVKGYENLDTSKATDVSGMFANYNDNNDNPVSLDLAKLDVDRVNEDKSTTPFGASVAGGFSGMVGGANINSLNIGDWKPQIPLTGMFDGSMSSNLTELTLSPQDDLTGSKLLGPDTTEDKDPAKYTGNWENRQDQYIKHGDPNKKTYSTTDLIGKYNGQLAITENETYQWEPQVTPGNPVTIHYIDQDGKSIQADSQLPGALGTDYTVKPAAIKGYQYVKATEGSLTGTYTADPQSVTLSYKVAPIIPTGSGTSTSTSESSSSSDSSSTGDQKQPVVVAKKDRAITVVKKIGFYRTPDFSKKTRQYYYAKQKRSRRPQFVIMGVAYSKNGTKRYLVRDVTSGSKRYGKTGYITAKRAFTVHSYYQGNPKRIKVIWKTNAYRDKALKHQVKHLKRGEILRVKKIVRYHLTTRLMLSDGSFVTSNKTRVIKK